MMKNLCALASIVLTAGCAAVPPTVHSYRSFETIEAPYDTTWEVILDLFARKKWPIDKEVQGLGVVQSEWVKDDMKGGDYGIEGWPSHTLLDTRQMVVNVQATKVSENHTRVRVHCFFRVKWSFGKREEWGSGTSKGVVEEKVLELIGKALPPDKAKPHWTGGSG